MKTGFVFMTVLAIVTMLVTGCAVPGAPSPTPAPGDSVPAPTPGAPTPSPTPAPGPTTQPPGPGKTGTIEVRITDAPPEYGEIKEILVTVVDSEEAIMVHKAVAEQEQLGGGEQNQVQNQVQQGEGEWINIPIIGDNTFELLELKEEGVDLLLGWAEVPTGKYTQIRMTIKEVKVIFEGDTEEDGDDVEKVAKLPSGKLKFVRPFDVVDGETTIILLDFLAGKSVTIIGKGDVIFKPVVKLVVSGKGKPIELEATLEVKDEATAELSTEKAHRGKDSVHLETTGSEGAGDEARIVIPLPTGTTLDDIESISWWEYLVKGYPPHIDISLDTNDDGEVDDRLVFEYAYNTEDHYADAPMPYGALTDEWYKTFSDDGEGPAQIDDAANGWLASGPPGPPGDPNFIYGTLEEWKAGSVDASINGDTLVLAFEIELDNWVVQTEAYVDDIEIVIGGVTYSVGL